VCVHDDTTAGVSGDARMLRFVRQVLRQQQVGRIGELERELMALRGRHTETIQQLKKAFLQEKHDCQANADRRISEMSKQANQVCIDAL